MSHKVCINTARLAGKIDALCKDDPSQSRYSIIKNALEAGLDEALAAKGLSYEDTSKRGGRPRKVVDDLTKDEKGETITLEDYLKEELAKEVGKEVKKRLSRSDVVKIQYRRQLFDKGVYVHKPSDPLAGIKARFGDLLSIDSDEDKS